MSDPDLTDDSDWHRLLLARLVSLYDADDAPVVEQRIFDGLQYTRGSSPTFIPPGVEAPESFSLLLDDLADAGLLTTDSSPGTRRPERRWTPTDTGRRRLAEPPTT